MARNPSPLETAPPRQGPALPLPPEPCRLPRRPRTARLPTAGFAALEKKNKLWIWLAFDRSGQRLVDWQCGGRDAATLNRLLERLKPWSVTLYCTDDYAPYDKLLPVGRHYIGKDETVAIERVNRQPFTSPTIFASRCYQTLNRFIYSLV